MRGFFALALLGATATATVLDTVKVMDGETPVMNVDAKTYARQTGFKESQMLWLTVEMSVELQGDLVINDTTALPFAWMCFTDPISPFTKNLNPNPFQCLDLSWGRKDQDVEIQQYWTTIAQDGNNLEKMGEVSKFADSRSYFADIVTKKKGVVYGFSNAQQQLEKGGWNIKTDGRKQDDTSKWDLGLDDDFVGEKKAMASIERSQAVGASMIDPELAKLPDSKFAGTWGGWLNVIEGKKSFMKEQAFTAYFNEGSGEDSAFTLSMTGLALAVSAFAF